MFAVTRRTLHRIAIVLGASALVLFLATCSKTKAPEQLSIGDLSLPLLGLVYVAEANGYFKDENLNLIYKPFTSGRDAVNAVLAGNLDIAVATEFVFAKEGLQGSPLRVIGTLHRTNRNSAVVARADRGIAKAADLRGKKIGLTPGTNTEFMLSVMLGEVGVADSAIEPVPLKPAELANALQDGRVDAIATWFPHTNDAKARFANDAAVFLRTDTYTELSLLGVRPETIASKRDALQRLVNALVRAEIFAMSHGNETMKIVLARLGSKDAEPLRKYWSSLRLQVRLDNLLLTALNNEGVWLTKRMRSAPPIPNYGGMIDTQFLEAAHAQSVTVSIVDKE